LLFGRDLLEYSFVAPSGNRVNLQHEKSNVSASTLGEVGITVRDYGGITGDYGDALLNPSTEDFRAGGKNTARLDPSEKRG
jgi:hypothetical protein